MKLFAAITAMLLFVACDVFNSTDDNLVLYDKLEGDWKTSFSDIEQPNKKSVRVRNSTWTSVTAIQPNAIDKSLDSAVANCKIVLSNDTLKRDCNKTYFYSNGKVLSKELNASKAIVFENENTFHITNIDDVKKENGSYQINNDWETYTRSK